MTDKPVRCWEKAAELSTDVAQLEADYLKLRQDYVALRISVDNAMLQHRTGQPADNTMGNLQRILNALPCARIA